MNYDYLSSHLGKPIAINPINGLTLTITTMVEIVRILEFEALLEDNFDVFNVCYVPYGLTDVDFKEDLANKVPMVLISCNEDDYTIPANRFTIVDGNNIPYNNFVIAVNLGLLFNETELDTIRNDVEELINRRLGITSNAEIVVVGDAIKIDEATHVLRESIIKDKIDDQDDFFTERQKLIELNIKLEHKITALETYIENN